MLYWILLTCFINMSIMDLRFPGQVWPFPNTHQASAAIIEAAVHAKDASKKIYPRKVGKGNSAPLWVPSFVDIWKAVEFSKDVPCWCFIDTPWKSSFIESNKLGVDWVVSCQTQVRLEQNYIDTHAFSAILDAKFGDSGRGICCDARSKWFTPQSWHAVRFEMSSACQVLHWYTSRCTPHNCNQQVGTQGNCPCFGAGKKVRFSENWIVFLVISSLGSSQIQLAEIARWFGVRYCMIQYQMQKKNSCVHKLS